MVFGKMWGGGDGSEWQCGIDVRMVRREAWDRGDTYC